MGGFVLENFLIKKEGWAKNAYLLHRFSKKCHKISWKNKITAEAPRKFFLALVVAKPLKNVLIYTLVYLLLPKNEAN